MSTTWILIADAARARLFSREGAQPTLLEIADFVCPEARAKGGAFTSDRHASVSVAHGRLGHAGHTIEPRTDARDKAAAAFAQQLTAALARGRAERRWDALVLASSPRFLGILRATLEPSLRALVVREIDRDLTGADADELLAHLA
jgi:protein required for attachment to host cells